MIDARNYGSTTQTIQNTVTLGNYSGTHSETLIVNPNTEFSCTITSGTPCFLLYAGSALVGGPGAAAVQHPNRGIMLAGGASVSALMELTSNSSNSSTRVSGITLQAVSGSVSSALLYLTNVFQPTTVADVDVSSKLETVGILVTGSTNIVFDNVNSGGCCGAINANFVPLRVTYSENILFNQGSYAHPGSSAPAIVDLEYSSSGVTGNVTFVAPQIECLNANDVGFLDNGIESFTVVGGMSTAGATGCGTDVFHISNPGGVLDDVTVVGFDAQSWGFSKNSNNVQQNSVNNTVTGTTISDGTRVTYYYNMARNTPKVILDGSMIGFGAGVTDANLPGAAPNGSIIYCRDCTVANSCASGGTGAIAKRLNGAWVCD